MLHAEFAVPPRVRLHSTLALYPSRTVIYLPGVGPVDCMHKPLTALHAVHMHCIMHDVGSTTR